MTSRKTLDARVAGSQFEFPKHPRVEPLTIAAVLRNRPSPPQCVSEGATVAEALRLMATHDVGAVLLLDDQGGVVGIFSEREYARNAILAPELATVRELMIACLATATPADSAPHCLRAMTEHGLRYIAVLDGSAPLALLALDDLLGEMIAYLEGVFKAHELDRQIVSLRGTYSC